MSSLTNNQVNSRSMNGLVNIDANSGTFDEIDCNTLNVALSATAPTRSSGDNTTHVATTQFVQSAITTAGANYVDLTSTQTITGEKFFTGAVEFGPATLTAVDINSSGLIDCNDIYINGQLNFGSVAINESGVGDLEMNNLTNGGKYIFKADDTGGTSREALNLSASFATFNGTIVASGGTFNTALPTSTLTPTTSTQLTTKAYVDSVSSGGVSLAGTNVWTGTNSFNTNLPTSTQTPTTATQLTTKTYVDSNFVNLTGTQTISGEKTFSNANTFITGNLNVPTITTTLGTSMTIQTDPSGFSDNINMYSNNEVILNSGYSTNINGTTFITQTAGTGIFLTTNGSAGLNFTDNFGGAIGMQFTGTNFTFNNSTGKTDFNGNVNIKNTSTFSVGTGTTTFAGGAVDVSGGKLTSGGQFALKSGGADRLTLDHASGYTYMRIKTAGQALVIGATSDNVNYAMQINDTTGAGTYQKSAIFIPDQATFSLIPSGTIMMNVSNSIPNGYVYCDGTGYSTTNVATNKYYTLFTVIGYAFGGSGGTFNVPNFRGAFLRGESSQVVNGITYSAGTRGTPQAHQLENHKHTYSDMMWWDTDTGGGSGQTIYVAGADFQTPGGDTVGSNGDGNFSNRLTKATYPATAVNPGTPIQQWNAPTNVSALTGDNTYPMNYSVYYIIKI